MKPVVVETSQSAVFRKFPPVTELLMASMSAVIIGGIYIAANIPVVPSLGLPFVMLGVGALLSLLAVVWLSRVTEFAWGSFFKVARWGLIPYLVISGMLEFVFLYDHVGGRELVVMTLSLVIFALDIPCLLGFTVARYDTSEGHDPLKSK